MSVPQVRSPGDTFTLLTATDGLTGTFDSVAITGLDSGFEYEITIKEVSGAYPSIFPPKNIINQFVRKLDR